MRNMSINTMLQDYISPMDFVGLVRCIAEFEGVPQEELETGLDLDMFYYAVIQKQEKVEVLGSAVRLFAKQPLELLQTAAHEIGHFRCGHLKHSFKQFIKFMFRPTTTWKEEEGEADKWAETYASKSEWKTCYRGWDFL